MIYLHLNSKNIEIGRQKKTFAKIDQGHKIILIKASHITSYHHHHHEFYVLVNIIFCYTTIYTIHEKSFQSCFMNSLMQRESMLHIAYFKAF